MQRSLQSHTTRILRLVALRAPRDGDRAFKHVRTLIDPSGLDLGCGSAVQVQTRAFSDFTRASLPLPFLAIC